MDPLLEKERDRRTATESVRDTLARVSIGAAVIWVFFLAATGLGLRPGVTLRAWSSTVDLLSLLAALALARRVRRTNASLAELHAQGYLLAGIAAANNLTSAIYLHDARELHYGTLVILGIGAVLIDRPSSAIASIVIASSSVLVAAKIGTIGDIEHMAVTMAASMMLGAAIQAARRSHLKTISTLRGEEAARATELSTALARLEAELAERRKAEERREELEAELRQVQKLDAIGTLAGGVAHDMNNVLASIVAIAELGQEEQKEGSQARDDFGHILTAAQRGASLTRNLLGFARRGKIRHLPFALEDVVRDVVALLERTTPRRITFEMDLVEDASAIVGDPAQVGQAVMNVCLNAIDAIPGEGRIVLRTSRAVVESESASGAVGPCAVLQIIDDGVGMTSDAREHAFEPFFSTKSSTGGTGLGLAMVYGTVREHHGDATISSAPSKGTTVTLRLPLAEHAIVSKPKRTSMHVPVHASVLIIDDEPLVRSAIRRCLRQADVTCAEAEGGAAGVEIFRPDPEAFGLVILDLAMPGMGGAECFDALRAIDPTIPILILSGFPKNQSVEELLAKGGAEFMTKPFERAALVEAVRRWSRVPAAIAAG